MCSLLSRDLLSYLFSFLSSQDRSIACSVSQLFYEYAIKISKSLSVVPYLYDGSEDELTYAITKQILASGDYHLIVRLKKRELINLQLACRGDHLPIVQLIIEKGGGNWEKVGGNWSWALYRACKGGNLQIVQFLMNHHQKNVTEIDETDIFNWNWALEGACKGGHLSLVELMIEKGANLWDGGLWGACQGGHLSIAQLMIKKGANAWNRGLYMACQGNHKPIVELMVQKGAKQHDISCECRKPG